MENSVDMLRYERLLHQKGKTAVCGIDEAGRGPLAGPVACACCMMPIENINPFINDSKQLSAKKREALYEFIMAQAQAMSCVFIYPEEIDRINILEATKKGMREAYERMSVKPDAVLIDAVSLDLDVETIPIIHGDALSYNIAAASIIAKVQRDKLMQEYDELYPQYGFCNHKGYGTKEHIEAILKYGATDIHRKTFLRKLYAKQ